MSLNDWKASHSCMIIQKFWNSFHVLKWRGTPAWGNRPYRADRHDFRPVSTPCQNGELADTASKCGRYCTSLLVTPIAMSPLDTPTLTCRPTSNPMVGFGHGRNVISSSSLPGPATPGVNVVGRFMTCLFHGDSGHLRLSQPGKVRHSQDGRKLLFTTPAQGRQGANSMPHLRT